MSRCQSGHILTARILPGERTRDLQAAEAGFSLIEVMLAMMILPIAIVGVMGIFEWAEQGRSYAAIGTRASVLVTSRIDAKLAGSWEQLLADDLDMDGVSEQLMRDDGQGGDETGGDGVYTTSLDREGIRLTWTVQADRPGPLAQAGTVVIRAWAAFPGIKGRPTVIRAGTFRANPLFLGSSGGRT